MRKQTASFPAISMHNFEQPEIWLVPRTLQRQCNVAGAMQCTVCLLSSAGRDRHFYFRLHSRVNTLDRLGLGFCDLSTRRAAQ